MRRSAVVLLAATWPHVASAQGANALNDTQKLGQRLFDRSCVVCHLPPQLGSAQYAPTLSKDTLGGQADVMREVISNGTPRMPGFKVLFQPGQIDTIVAYLKTVPTPPPPPPANPAPR